MWVNAIKSCMPCHIHKNMYCKNAVGTVYSVDQCGTSLCTDNVDRGE